MPLKPCDRNSRKQCKICFEHGMPSFTISATRPIPTNLVADDYEHKQTSRSSQHRSFGIG
jgi:hypothetical protein